MAEVVETNHNILARKMRRFEDALAELKNAHREELREKEREIESLHKKNMEQLAKV